MVKNNFVAVDFETAQSAWKKQTFICQVGIVVVQNGEIVERVSRLVKPPGNKYEKACSDVHGIIPKTTKHEPSFDVVWADIEKYFVNTILVAHNAYDFDEKVLWQNLDYYGIHPCGINKFIDSKLLFNTSSRSLDALCYGFGIGCENHHDACADAECCAKIYLQYLHNNYPDISRIEEYREMKSLYIEEQREKENDFSALKIMSDEEFEAVLSPDFFNGKTVINTGDLSCIDREELKVLVSERNGRYVSSISSKVEIVVLGDSPGPKKQRAIISLQQSGNEIVCINENHLEKFLNLLK